MAQTNFNTSFPNDGLGDKLRDAFLAQQAMNTELYANKVDKVVGKGLSDNNYDNTDKAKVDALTGNEEQNVQSDWNELDPTSDAFILGKPIFSTNEIIVSAIWTGAGLNFDVSADAFPINGVSYPATPDVVTLDAADATLDRIDLIVAIKPVDPLTVGTVGKITGTPASTALVVPPDYDPSLYYVIKQVSVLAAATEPDGAVNTVIFDEYIGGEWDAQLYGSGAINTSDPSSGSTCIEFFSANSTDVVIFVADAPLSTGDLDLLQFDIKLKEAAIGKYFVIRLRLDGVVVKSMSFNSYEFSGFDDSNLSYQTVSIEKSMINAVITEFDEIQMFFFAPDISGYYIDNVKMFTGSGSETIPQTGIQDAPSDGILRGRKNGAWEAIPAGGFQSEVNPATAKTMPVDADLFGLLDSAAAFITKKLSWANLKANLKTYFDGLYSQKYGTRIVNAAVTTTYTLDHNAANDWKLTLTGNTTFSDSNLPTGTNTKEFTIKMTGAFIPTFPAYWGTVQGDVYDGARWNFYIVQIHNGTAASEEFTVFNTILT